MKNDRVYLEHIRDALQDIVTYTRPGPDSFFVDRMTQDATLRKLEVIGQESLRSDQITPARNPVEQIAAMRDKVIHDYLAWNLEIIWAVIEKELPTHLSTGAQIH